MESDLLKVQEDFDEVIKTYPESFKAMDLVAEHRIRALHRSPAWLRRQGQADTSPHLGDIIEHILEVIYCPFAQHNRC